MMKKMFVTTAMLFCILHLSASKINNAEDLKRFYVEYCTYIHDDAKLDSLLRASCTKELVKEWYELVVSIGLYDPFTNGICDDFELTKKTVAVHKERDYYVVSFKYLNWPEDNMLTESVIIYVNKEGKISHTKRPSDGYMTPSK